MKTLNREEAIKAMANGEVVEEAITTSVGDARRYKFDCDGILIVSNNSGDTWKSSNGLNITQCQIVKQKKKYWFWCDPKNGEVCKYLADDSRRILNGCVLDDNYSEKLEWSEVEL